MRFILTDERGISLGVLEGALREVEGAYSIERDEEGDDEGTLTHGGDVYGHAVVNRPGDGIFDEEIEELKGFVGRVGGERKSEVLGVLSRAVAIVAVRVLWAARETEETLEKIDPLWRWLFANRRGLLQADGEGYYDASGLILEVG